MKSVGRIERFELPGTTVYRCFLERNSELEYLAWRRLAVSQKLDCFQLLGVVELMGMKVAIGVTFELVPEPLEPGSMKILSPHCGQAHKYWALRLGQNRKRRSWNAYQSVKLYSSTAWRSDDHTQRLRVHRIRRDCPEGHPVPEQRNRKCESLEYTCRQTPSKHSDSTPWAFYMWRRVRRLVVRMWSPAVVCPPASYSCTRKRDVVKRRIPGCSGMPVALNLNTYYWRQFRDWHPCLAEHHVGGGAVKGWCLQAPSGFQLAALTHTIVLHYSSTLNCMKCWENVGFISSSTCC